MEAYSPDLSTPCLWAGFELFLTILMYVPVPS
jgi:hypothetical protein